MAVLNFNEYFRHERPVYVKNVSGGAFVSVEFPIDSNHVESHTFPPSKDPEDLTQHFPFDVIKRSMDLRKLIARRPPALELLSEEEYKEYYRKKAVSSGLVDGQGNPDVDAAISQAADRRARAVSKSEVPLDTPKPLPGKVVEKGTGDHSMARYGERNRVVGEQIAEDEVIRGKVLHLMNQVKSELPEEQRMPAAQLIQELDDIPDLTLDELEHIRAHAFYKTVKSYAKKKMEELATNDDSDNE